MSYIATPAARRPAWFVGAATAVLDEHPVHDAILRLWHDGGVLGRIPPPAVAGDPINAATEALTAHGWKPGTWWQADGYWTANLTAGEG